jgi:hypothetical protein
VRRDEEIVRLTKYAEGMGLKVLFSNAKSLDAASWNIDGSQITIYLRKSNSKTATVLSMIHEIAHHLWFIHEKNRKPDMKFDQAIEFEMWREPDKPIRKSYRKRIYEMERASTVWWDAIYKETNIGIPKWKLYASMEFDIWQYEVYYHKGSFPPLSERRATYKAIKDKHRALKETYA